MCLCYLFSAKTAWQLVNRKADFCFYKANRFESIRITNRIDSNRELECFSRDSFNDSWRRAHRQVTHGECCAATDWTMWLCQGRRQVKICGVDRHGERGARAYNGSLEAEKIPLFPSICKNSSDLYEFQQRPLAKVGWTCPPKSTPWRRHWAPQHVYIPL